MCVYILYALLLVDLVKGSLGEGVAELIAGDLSQVIKRAYPI